MPLVAGRLVEIRRRLYLHQKNWSKLIILNIRPNLTWAKRYFYFRSTIQILKRQINLRFELNDYLDTLDLNIVTRQNFDFIQSFDFWPKIRSSSKHSSFDKNFDLLEKVSIFDQNFNLGPKFQSLAKISIFDQNFDLWLFWETCMKVIVITFGVLKVTHSFWNFKNVLLNFNWRIVSI